MERFQLDHQRLFYIFQYHLVDQSIRNSISRYISDASDEDWIIISDLDEIPNPKTICNFDPTFKFAVFQQKLFYYI